MATATAGERGTEGLAAGRHREHAGRVEQRSADAADAAGDFEYDEAHERAAGVPGRPAERRPGPAPTARPPSEPDGDMSYDEAHDF